jgi:purine-cytosine permease-like protein
MFLEHVCFRRGFQYDIEAWDNPKKLPVVITAFFTFCVGTVLAIMCMSQSWVCSLLLGHAIEHLKLILCST